MKDGSGCPTLLKLDPDPVFPWQPEALEGLPYDWQLESQLIAKPVWAATPSLDNSRPYSSAEDLLSPTTRGKHASVLTTSSSFTLKDRLLKLRSVPSVTWNKHENENLHMY